MSKARWPRPQETKTIPAGGGVRAWAATSQRWAPEGLSSQRAEKGQANETQDVSAPEHTHVDSITDGARNPAIPSALRGTCLRGTCNRKPRWDKNIIFSDGFENEGRALKR